MKLGLVTNIHEQVELLRIALDRFDKERVDQVVMIGDVFEMGERIEETCRLLATPEEVTGWDGGSPIRLLDDQRYFVVVGALCEGRFAVFDTDTSVLMPFNED